MSVKVTGSGTVPELTFAANDVTGVVADPTVMYPALVTVSLPSALETLRVTV
jgi:hypothetical protein